MGIGLRAKRHRGHNFSAGEDVSLWRELESAGLPNSKFAPSLLGHFSWVSRIWAGKAWEFFTNYKQFWLLLWRGWSLPTPLWWPDWEITLRTKQLQLAPLQKSKWLYFTCICICICFCIFAFVFAFVFIFVFVLEQAAATCFSSMLPEKSKQPKSNLCWKTGTSRSLDWGLFGPGPKSTDLGPEFENKIFLV